MTGAEKKAAAQRETMTIVEVTCKKCGAFIGHEGFVESRPEVLNAKRTTLKLSVEPHHCAEAS